MSLKETAPPGPQAPRDAAIPAVCRLLRSKTAYGSSERGAEWKRGDSTTAVYWCLATMEPVGADDDFCHPHRCQRGRACFEPCAGEEEAGEA